MTEESYRVEHYPFVIDETPQCLWADDLLKTNMEYLESLAPEYFIYLAQTFADLLEGEQTQYAAIALRTAYSQALETLFALLGAFVQAPHCPVGWLLRYKSGELYKLTRKIHEYEPVIHRLNLEQVTWDALAKIVHSHPTGDAEKDNVRASSFGSLWSQLADEFLRDEFSDEYNSIKHGLRVYMGGFSLRLGRETQVGAPVPASQMVTMGSSEFGSAFFTDTDLKAPKNNANFYIAEQRRAWNPERFVVTLPLIAMSMINVINAFKGVLGVPADQLKFVEPIDFAHFGQPILHLGNEVSSRWHPGYHAENFPVMTKQDILASYPAIIPQISTPSE